MKLLYEKGIPLLFAIMLSIQEVKWGEISVPYWTILLVCTFSMIGVLVYEKKQWNLFVGLLLFLTSVLVVLGVQDRLIGNGFVLLCIAFLIQTVVLTVVMKYTYAKCILTSGFLISFIVLRLCLIPVSPFFVFLILFCFFISCSELIHITYYKSPLDTKRTMGLLPVFILLLFIVFDIPVKENPFDWSFITRPVSKVCENVRVIVENIRDSWDDNGDYFSYQLYDKSDGESKLGGDVDITERILLKTKGIRSREHTIYLNGSVFDTYTGSGWTKSKKKGVLDEQELARKEIKTACESQQWNQIQDEFVFQERQVDIQYGRLRTKTIFYPEYLSSFSCINKSLKIEKQSANLAFAKMRKRGYEYRAYYKDVNLNSEYVKGYLRTLDPFSHEDVLLRKRAEYIKDVDLQLPDDLPNSVRELANQVTSAETNSYDKMAAICSFLRQYTYSKDVEEVSTGQDFVEDFLYRTKSGYCTYFATSAAVMGRCVGIPTRYVEGAIVSKDCKKKKGYSLLDGNSLHAWCEAYFEGFGWVRFEATPGYGDTGGGWKKTSGKNYYEQNPIEASLMPEISSEPVENTVQTSKGDVGRRILLGLMCFVLTILVIFGMGVWNQRKKRTRDEQCIWRFKRILFYLRKLGFRIESGETLIEFRDRVQGKMRDMELWKGEQFEEVVDFYLKMRFGRVELENSELKKMEMFIEMLKGLCREKFGKGRCYMIVIEEKMIR